ncbi:MAG TPA: hypothetical protein VLA87_12405 [Gaiellaceae bacterium]|nr:hypothetical protein [Gaiellaceae bacterium]
MERFNAEFERDRFAYTEAGHRIAVAMIEMFVGKIPGLSKRLGTRGVCALLGEPLLAAPDLPGPTAAERRTAEGALKLRAGGRRRQTRLPCVRAGG